MLKAFIIEDEIPAQINMKRALNHNFDDIEVVGKTQSVKGAVEWLSTPGNETDIIFMDVELSDGMCFEIFKLVDVKAKVIITTAYDEYAIKAFKVNSVDYLLKPIDPKELIQAVNKCRKASGEQDSLPHKLEVVEQSVSGKGYKKRFAVKRGDKIIIISINDIAYVFSEDKTTYIVTYDNSKYIIDLSLDALMPMLDPHEFFRISRAYIASIRAIRSVSKHVSSRLKVMLIDNNDDDIFVSRTRTLEFMKWLDGE